MLSNEEHNSVLKKKYPLVGIGLLVLTIILLQLKSLKKAIPTNCSVGTPLDVFTTE